MYISTCICISLSLSASLFFFSLSLSLFLFPSVSVSLSLSLYFSFSLSPLEHVDRVHTKSDQDKIYPDLLEDLIQNMVSDEGSQASLKGFFS